MLFKNISLMDEAYNIKTNMNVVTEGNHITYMGKEMPEGYKGETYEGNNKFMLPGFFNIHCHIPMTLLRGYGEGLPLDRWLNEKMFPFEAKLTGEDCYWGAMLGAIELIKSGVVSITDMYFNIDHIIEALNTSGLKANICHGTSFNPDNPNFRDLKAYKDTDRWIKTLRQDLNSRIKIDVGIHAEYTSNEGLLREVAEYAKETNSIIHTHISETKKEHEECKNRYHLTPLGLYEKCGVLDQPVIAAHCVWIEEEDFNIIKNKDVTPVHCISSNLKLGSGFAPIKKMLEMGINVGLGTDGTSSNNNLNMMEEIHLAAMVNKGVNLDPEFLPPRKVLEFATINGAVSQGRADCGSIKVGNRADIVVIDIDKAHLQPVFDILSNIVYSAQADDICLTMIDGQIVYKDGELTTIDHERVIYESNKIKNRILGELN